MKLHSNGAGAYKSSVGLAGAGGLVRDSTGAWVAGFTYMIGTCSSTRRLGHRFAFCVEPGAKEVLKSIKNQWL